MEQCNTFDPKEVGGIISKAKRLAVRYYERTGRPLGITGEVAEYEAARLLKLKLATARQCGFDAIRKKDGCLLQIKGRVFSSKAGQRLGQIRFKHKWDAVLLVLLDSKFDPVAIYEAPRRAVRKALLAPGSKSRNERGALSISKFKSIAKCVWECG